MRSKGSTEKRTFARKNVPKMELLGTSRYKKLLCSSLKFDTTIQSFQVFKIGGINVSILRKHNFKSIRGYSGRYHVLSVQVRRGIKFVFLYSISEFHIVQFNCFTRAAVRLTTILQKTRKDLRM